MCLVSNERRENALEHEAYSLMKTWGDNENISLIKRVSFFLGHTVFIHYVYNNDTFFFG